MATNIQATFGAGGGLTAGDFQLGFRRVGRDSGVTSPRRRCTTKHRRDDDKGLYSIGRRRHALAKSFEERFVERNTLRERRIPMREDRE